MRWPWGLAVGTSLLVATMLVGGGWLLLAADLSGGAFAGLAAVAGGLAVLGLLVARREPRNVVGAMLTLVGALVAYLAGREVYYDAAAVGVVPLDRRVVAWLEESGWWLFVVVALLLLYFPEGRLVSPRWRVVPLGLVLLGAAQQVFGAFATAPFLAPLEGWARPYAPLPLGLRVLSEVVFGVFLGLVLVAAASVVVRFRRSTGRPRAQVKWLAIAGVVAVCYPFVCLAEIVVTGESGTVATVTGVLALVSLPTAVAVAVLQHDLYDVDRAVADAVTYAIVLVALLATYAVSALALGLVVGRGSAVAAATATAVCALVLAPLRSWLRRVVDRRLYPPRRAALAAIDELQHRIHAGEGSPEELEAVLRQALRDPELRVGYLVPGAAGFVDAAGEPVGGEVVPVMLGGVQIGVLAGNGSAVLRVVADAAASLVEVTRLRAELAGALREVEASRARLVQAGDAERRRLERDLHDGAQQRLVSLGMSLRLAQRHLADGTVDVDGVLDQGLPSWLRRWRSCGRSRTGCGRRAWTTGCRPRWRRSRGTCRFRCACRWWGMSCRSS
ncbi:histidine kinase [Kribbella italica]|uniref:Signal transduction histidine kinase n=1 Tax=Kribbella italica TaxID=1540520 RepID=A0A7W9MVB7_9ACTN|nr:histidine kinase dimerization/phosphoacceptor domain-containing protein [Kribbella italica]MBB5837644.1 signal transduction histidine kinase [Kribbella italica]